MPGLTETQDIIDAWRLMLQKWEIERAMQWAAELAPEDDDRSARTNRLNAARQTDNAILLLHYAICGDPPVAAPSPSEDAARAKRITVSERL